MHILYQKIPSMTFQKGRKYMNTQRFIKVLAIITASMLILSSSCTKLTPAETTPMETIAITTTAETTKAPTPTPIPTETVPVPTETTMPDLGPLNIANVDGVNDPIDPVVRKDPNIENILLL